MGSEFFTYLRLGLNHIADLRGYDHILFVAALTLAYRPAEWRRLLILVTAFTLGHSITLALATLGLVHVSGSVIEPAIAATIVCSSLVAIVLALKHKEVEGGAVAEAGPPGPPSGQTLRYTLAALFGLIHGLGFSTFLRSLLGGEESLFVPLLGFNIGLEVGQLLIVSVVLLLGAAAERWLRISRRDWILVVAGGITAVGLSMLLQRILPAT